MSARSDEPELTRAVESLASTYGEAARLLVVAERERVLREIEDAIRSVHQSLGAGPMRCLLYAAISRIRDGEPRGGAGEPQATGED